MLDVNQKLIDTLVATVVARLGGNWFLKGLAEEGVNQAYISVDFTMTDSAVFVFWRDSAVGYVKDQLKRTHIPLDQDQELVAPSEPVSEEALAVSVATFAPDCLKPLVEATVESLVNSVTRKPATSDSIRKRMNCTRSEAHEVLKALTNWGNNQLGK